MRLTLWGRFQHLTKLSEQICRCLLSCQPSAKVSGTRRRLATWCVVYTVLYLYSVLCILYYTYTVCCVLYYTYTVCCVYCIIPIQCVVYTVLYLYNVLCVLYYTYTMCCVYCIIPIQCCTLQMKAKFNWSCPDLQDCLKVVLGEEHWGEVIEKHTRVRTITKCTYYY